MFCFVMKSRLRDPSGFSSPVFSEKTRVKIEKRRTCPSTIMIVSQPSYERGKVRNAVVIKYLLGLNLDLGIGLRKERQEAFTTELGARTRLEHCLSFRRVLLCQRKSCIRKLILRGAQ